MFRRIKFRKVEEIELRFLLPAMQGDIGNVYFYIKRKYTQYVREMKSLYVCRLGVRWLDLLRMS